MKNFLLAFALVAVISSPAMATGFLSFGFGNNFGVNRFRANRFQQQRVLVVPQQNFRVQRFNNNFRHQQFNNFRQPIFGFNSGYGVQGFNGGGCGQFFGY